MIWDAARSGTRPIPLREVLRLLDAGLGRVEPWTARSDLEYVCGAILVQNTAWTNVRRALAALHGATAFDPRRLLALDEEDLTALVRPAGFMRAKSRALRAYARWSLGDDGRAARGLGDDALREALLALPGIGPETADVVALMVYRRPRFIFDAYGRRLLRQAGYAVERDWGYERARRALEPAVARAGLSTPDLVRFHELILEAGRRARAAGGWKSYGPTIGIDGA
ncbi:endonuclease III domain-containing protein [Actinomyces israelii]|uniref:endonuclease III domain-containing protein n=1 Tax=Actinomyces israelii TaxID=1659 RepID=UPI002555674A|nr:base excision DNA repair protein [Actinomyces israelii]WKR21333.1 Endonuclease III [Actinomyces israelii]